MSNVPPDEDLRNYSPHGPAMNGTSGTFAVQLHPPINGDKLFTAEVLLDGERVHRDTLNPDSEYHRGNFLDALERQLSARMIQLGKGQRRDLNSQLMFASPIGAKIDMSKMFSPMLRNMASVKPRSVSWLWKGWLPIGALTVFDAMPGVGKSQISCKLTAEQNNAGRSVLWLTDEDSEETTLVPRLLAAGADLESVNTFMAVQTDDEGEPIPVNLIDHVDALEQAVVTTGASLVVVDTIDSYAKDVNLNSNTEARAYLRPIARIAERQRCAVLFIRHFNKKECANAMNRGSGSRAIGAAMRAVWIAAEHPSEEDVYVLAVAKCNLAAKSTSIAYKLAAQTIYGDDQQPIPTCRAEFLGNVQFSADELMTTNKSGGKCGECVALIQSLLAGGPQLATDLEAKCAAAGFSQSTYRRACKAAGVQREKTGFQGAWVVFIKDAQPDF